MSGLAEDVHHRAEISLVCAIYCQALILRQPGFFQRLEALFEWLQAGVEMQVGLGIKGRPAAQDAAQVLHGFRAGRHRSRVALRQHPRHVVFGRGLQPNGEALRQHHVEGGFLRHQAAGRGHDQFRRKKS